MPYRFTADGAFECDTPDELIAVMRRNLARKTETATETAAPQRRKGLRGRRKKRNRSVARSWAAARELAKKDGISVREARSKLARQK